MKTLIQWVSGKIPSSYRTKLGGVGLILLGLIGGLNIFFPDLIPNAPVMSIEECLASLSGGFIAIGIGKKIDKNTDAITAAKTEIQ